MIRLDNVSKVFGTGVAGLVDVSLLIDKGEFVFLVGHTGSGKTTLLRLLVREVLPTQGTVIVSDLDVVKLPNNKIPALRKKIGVVFQDLKLLTDRTIIENIILPMQVAGLKLSDAVIHAEELLGMVGVLDHRDKYPIQLSGGELQRVAIARALALSPEILLADEPTGNLDPQTALEIVQLLEKINQMGTTIVMATHNIDIVNKLKKRVVGLEKGKVIKDEKEHGKSDKKEEKEIEVKSEEKEASPTPPTSGTEELQGHKKETKKLADLLAKARMTLHRKSDAKVEVEEVSTVAEDALPFGFEKDPQSIEQDAKIEEKK